MKKVVIIGGGFTGARCAKALEKDFSVTLIDNKPYFEFTPSILRTLLEPRHQKSIQVMHSDYLNRGKTVYDTVLNVTEKEVITKNKRYAFDYLIIASGSYYASPIKEPNVVSAVRAKELAKYNKEVYDAKDLLIIGGGLVGTELAAEICTHCMGRKMTIVHLHEELMERNHPKARAYAQKFLEKKGVKIIFGEKVVGKLGKKKGTFVTDKGTKIKADLAFICTGIKSNSKFLEKNMSSLLNEKGQIEVNEYLQVNNLKNIFAGGDVTAIKEEKTAQTAENHASLIVKNIRRLEAGKKLDKYKNKRRAMVISLGKYNGIFDNGKFVFTGLIPAFMKWAVERKTIFRYRIFG